MSSVVFPAFQHAQQGQSGDKRYGHSAEQLYQSVENAIGRPDASAHSEAPSASDLAAVASPSSATVASAVASSKPSNDSALARSRPKITKRINARLQLAAALIEADNDSILENAQFWHIYHPPQPSGEPRPPPPPQPALASQSAIFAPYRQGAGPSITRHVRTWSGATGISRLLEPDQNGGRPSIDFLGVALPTEKKTRSRAGSIISLAADRHNRTDSLLSTGTASIFGRPSMAESRPGSVLSGTFPAAADAIEPDINLSDWGVDKFLSKEEKERISIDRRSRANSVAAIVSRPISAIYETPHDDSAAVASHSLNESRTSLELAKSSSRDAITVGKAKSDIVATSSAAANFAPQSSKLELLARIKLYRERQENLPPSAWDGPGPTASKDELVDHIISSSPLIKRKSLRDASHQLNTEEALADPKLGHTRVPSSTISILDRPRPLSRAESSSALHTEPSAADVNQSAALLASRSFDHQLQVSTHIADRHASTAAELGSGDWSKHGNSLLSAAAVVLSPVAVVSETDASQQELTQPFDTQASSVVNSVQSNPNLARPPTISNDVQEADDSKDSANDVNDISEPLNMVGVGSYSRSHSRRNSIMGSPFFNAGTPAGVDGSAPSPSFQLSQLGPPVVNGFQSIPTRRLPQDPFASHELGLGPSPFAAALHAASPRFVVSSELPGSTNHAFAPAIQPIDPANLTTKQLQTIARNSTFPSHLGINRDLLDTMTYEGYNDDDNFGQTGDSANKLPSIDIESLTDDIARTGDENFQIHLGGNTAPDLSSANWGKPRKKWFRLSTMVDAKREKKTRKTQEEGESDAEVLPSVAAAADQLDITSQDPPDLSDSYAAEPTAKTNLELAGQQGRSDDDIDDDYISPPRKGPLRPLGLTARLPKTIVMPQPLQGTELAPKLRLTQPTEEMMLASKKRHSLHVPEGFVLHDTRGGLPPMRSIVVRSANGPQPMFASLAKSKKHARIISELKAIEVGRTLQVPAAAPRGIGRRAAAPSTALFRNQLVQHDDEREGWGWELGTSPDVIFKPNAEDDSDDDDKPLAELKKQSRSAKRAAKRLAKEKRKRKAARRKRRAKREEALRDGKLYDKAAAEELSPDEDLDLSSTTTEEDATDSETDSDLWDSDDDKRWIDDQKPAGKLYGKSLLDIATERTAERKSKTRYYGQAQLEEEDSTMVRLEDDGQPMASRKNLSVSGVGDERAASDDGASIAPSVARTFRDKPVGYNDTKERMQAVFGPDQVWAREMAKRQEEELREAEAEKAAGTAAEASGESKAQEKEKGLFSRNKKNKKKETATALRISYPILENSGVNLQGISASSVTTSSEAAIGLVNERSEEAEAEAQRSQRLLRPPTIVLDMDGDGDAEGGRRMSGLLAGEEKAAEDWLLVSDHGSVNADSSDDDMPLAQVKKNVSSRPVSFAASLTLDPIRRNQEASSDEELPLAALKEKRARQSMVLGGGRLDLDFSSPRASLASPRIPRSASGGSSIGGDEASHKFLPAHAEVSDSDDDDLPLGQRHPGGDSALIAVRAAIEEKKRAAKELKKAQKAQKRAAKLAATVDQNNGKEDTTTDDLADNKESAAGQQARNPVVDSDSSNDEDDSEDDKPLAYAHPQAAIISEQAAIIRQLQLERAQQNAVMPPTGSVMPSPHLPMLAGGPGSGYSNMGVRGVMGSMNGMAGMMDPRQSMMGLPNGAGSMILGMAPGFDGFASPSTALPMGLSLPMGFDSMNGVAPTDSHLRFGGSVAGDASVGTPNITIDVLPASSAAQIPATPHNPMTLLLDPKASSIHNWRTQVPPDATAAITPSGGSSAINSSS